MLRETSSTGPSYPQLSRRDAIRKVAVETGLILGPLSALRLYIGDLPRMKEYTYQINKERYGLDPRQLMIEAYKRNWPSLAVHVASGIAFTWAIDKFTNASSIRKSERMSDEQNAEICAARSIGRREFLRDLAGAAAVGIALAEVSTSEVNIFEAK